MRQVELEENVRSLWVNEHINLLAVFICSQNSEGDLTAH